jgi:LPS export ABC transporter protein LptC
MSREQVRFLIALIVAISLAAVGYHVAATLRAQRIQEENLSPMVKDVLPDTDQRMQNFHRAKIRDGKKVWEVTARQARYTEESSIIIVESPDVTLYLKDGNPVALRCQEGRIYLDDHQEVSSMELTGNVEVRVNDLVITTTTAMYKQEGNTLSSSAPLRIVGRGLEAEGQGYTVDITEKRLNLHADVNTTFTNAKRES